jgi:hypothetical protein
MTNLWDDRTPRARLKPDPNGNESVVLCARTSCGEWLATRSDWVQKVQWASGVDAVLAWLVAMATLSAFTSAVRCVVAVMAYRRDS